MIFFALFMIVLIALIYYGFKTFVYLHPKEELSVDNIELYMALIALRGFVLRTKVREGSNCMSLNVGDTHIEYIGLCTLTKSLYNNGVISKNRKCLLLKVLEENKPEDVKTEAYWFTLPQCDAKLARRERIEFLNSLIVKYC